MKRWQTCSLCEARWAQKKGLCARCYRTRYPGPLPVSFKVETVRFTRPRAPEPAEPPPPVLYRIHAHGEEFEVTYSGKTMPRSSGLIGSQLAGESGNSLMRMRW